MARNFRKSSQRGVFILAVLLLGGWLLPSFFSVEHYRRRLKTGLERALHRPVSFDAISFRLLPRPGFLIANVVVREDPSFGSEPFVRVERIECDLRWHSLWRPRVDFSRLRLEHASFNFVRNAQGNWSVANLLHQAGVAAPLAGPAANKNLTMGFLAIEADDARINFIVGANKKPLAITRLSARLEFDPTHSLLRYHVVGTPIRTDLSLPSPGLLELKGEWTPGKDLAGPLDATVRSRGTLLYDWVPLLTGHNLGIYGVIDADIHATGSVNVVKLEGECRFAQLHRWEQIPPSDSVPVTLYLRAEFDRIHGRVLFESLEASFADSNLHLTGALDNIPDAPELDLVVALERSRLEDVLALGRCFGARLGAFGVSGRVDGLCAVQGPWRKRRYGGFVSARDVHLHTPTGTFPISEAAVRIDKNGARLAPTKVTLAPHVELVAEGTLGRAHHFKRLLDAGPCYDLVLSAKAIPLRDLVRFARAVGVRPAQNLDAQGVGTGAFHLAGTIWPLGRPKITGRAEIRTVRLVLPGLTEPLNLPEVRLEVDGNHIVADRAVAVIGTSVFSGGLQHGGDRKQPWEFDIRARSLSLEEGASWFDALGLRRAEPLIERLPGMNSLAARRVAASSLFGALNAKGRFSSPAVTYRGLTLRDFRASVEISDRIVRLSKAKFQVAGGRGQGRVQVNLNETSALVTTDVTFADASLQMLAPHLPLVLRRLHGSFSGGGHFETRGLTHEEMRANLQGQATVRLGNVYLVDFDPIGVIARKTGRGSLEPARGQVVLRSASATFRVRDHHVFLENNQLDVVGAKLNLAGSYAFDGSVDLDVVADFRHVRRRWLKADEEVTSGPPLESLHLAGPLDRLAVVPETQVSRANR